MTNNNSSGESAWHTLSGQDICEKLHVDPVDGLAEDDVTSRQQQFGLNRIEEKARKPLWRLFVSQFTDFMILVLIAAAVVSGLVGDVRDSMAIVVIIFLNAVIGFVQEYRAERAIAALKRMAAPSARVRRNGEVVQIPSEQLVPGDLVLLEAGESVAADIRLLETSSLRTGEAALTGESTPVEKDAGDTVEAGAVIGDRFNMAYKGTLVTHGTGQGVVVATGGQSELGQIAGLLGKESSLKTPLQRRLAYFGRRLAIAILIICAILFVGGLARGEPAVLMFLTAVSLAVAAIPEALPAVVTISLALGARTMARHQALIRRLPAVETLGSITFICSDKTGTLTQNRMHAEKVYADGETQSALPNADSASTVLRQLGQAMALNNEVSSNGNRDFLGDPTEVALYRAAQDAGFDKSDLQERFTRLGNIPFDSTRKRMTTLHQTPDGDVIAYSKGAPEQLLEVCSTQMTASGDDIQLDRTGLADVAESLAAHGYRVMAFALRRWPALPQERDPDSVERDLVFLGMVALMDPPRPEVEAAVGECRSAGVTPVMITGDHPATARAIAMRLGIAGRDDPVATGQELAGLDATALESRVSDVRVYARVTPEQKIHIVKALQKRGEIAAMTGDGVNDAPALKRADIGVAMGLSGTDVAREASDMVLLDDNFATIVRAIRQGRRIYDNIRKFIKYTMTSNFGEIWTLAMAPLLGLPIPLLPIHILWINLVTDGLPGLALAMEKEERGIMERPPRPPNEPVFAHGMWQHIILVGMVIGSLSIFAQWWSWSKGSDHWQTMVFTVLTFAQLVQALAIRSESDSLLRVGIFTNLHLIGAIVLTVVLQLMIIYVPFFNTIFKTTPLTLDELAFCFAVPWAVLVVVECEKWLRRKGWIYRE
jgi:Ca2+-transporting ATPase